MHSYTFFQLFFSMFLYLLAMFFFIICCLTIPIIFLIDEIRRKIQELHMDHAFLFPLIAYFYVSIFSIISIFLFNPIQNSHFINSLYPTFITIIGADILLTITLTFVIVQLHSQTYGYRVIEVLKIYWDFWILIVFELFFLIGEIYSYGNVFWMLFFGITSIIIIIPYLYLILVFIRPENLMTRFLKIISIRDSDGRILQNSTQAVFDIIIGAMTHNDLTTANHGFGILIGNDTKDKNDNKDKLEEIRNIIRKHYFEPENDLQAAQSVKGIVDRSINYIEFLMTKDHKDEADLKLLMDSYQYTPKQLRESLRKK